jgi:hypothetical protein
MTARTAMFVARNSKILFMDHSPLELAAYAAAGRALQDCCRMLPGFK